MTCERCNGEGWLVTYRSMHGLGEITEACECNPQPPETWADFGLKLLAASPILAVLAAVLWWLR